jgi:hypothetical protein
MKINGKQELLAYIARRGFVLATLLVMVLASAIASRAQSSPATPSTQDAKVAASAQPTSVVANLASASAKSQGAPEEKHSGKGAGEGIVVHGHWTITVKNPDGTISSHNAFENALDTLGPETLTGLLGGTTVPGGFQVTLDSATPGAGPCAGTIGSGILGAGGSTPSTTCFLVDSRTTYLGFGCQDQECSNNLAFAPTASSVGFVNGFTLSGSALANQSGTVGSVATAVLYCGARPRISSANPFQGASNPLAPFQCATTVPNLFTPPIVVGQAGRTNLTSRTLSTPIPVASGQTIAVTVAITFSSN